MYNPNKSKVKLAAAIIGAAVAVAVVFMIHKLGWLAKAKAKLVGMKKPVTAPVAEPAESGTASGDAIIEAS
jgi:hypothetical protein